MADYPVLRSREQIIGDLIDGFLARVDGVNDLNRASVLTQFFVAIGQDAFKSYADIISMIGANNIDRAIGDALQRKARDNNVPILSATEATTVVDITDLTFEKIATTVYAGQPAPVAGTLNLYAADASSFPSTGGQLYIGRNTPNSEGPLTYTSVTPQSGGSYYLITLATTTPTTNFHNFGESIILAQGGNRLIQAGTTVQTAQGIGVTSVSFTTDADATIIDGEVTVTLVPVVCGAAGTIGNVPAGAIVQAVGLPFTCSVNNPAAVFNGIPDDTNDTLRARIKAYELAKAKGTDSAIKQAAINVTSTDDLKQVTSSNIYNYADGSAALVFDDGSGYEPLFFGQGYEVIIDSAVGGEMEAQVRQVPVAQAQVISSAVAPFDIAALSWLSISIAGVTSSHQFQASDFQVAGAATAFEVAASINNDPNISFLANTAHGQTQVVVYPRSVTENDITVIPYTGGVDANTILEFPEEIAYSIRLYKNNVPLNQNGIIAEVTTRLQQLWSASIAPGETLTYIVDNTPPITITLTNDDFEVVDPEATVSSSTAIATWAAVLNNIMSGVNVIVNGQTLSFISNRGASSQAEISITGGTLLDKIFPIGVEISATGQTSDYSANLETGQITLAEPLDVGDQLALGSLNTRATAITGNLSSGPSVAGNAWFIVDGSIVIVPNGFLANTQVEFTKVGSKLTITAQSPVSVPTGFNEVQPGDWLLIWSNPTDPAALQSNSGFWRVETVSVGSITVDDGTNVRANQGVFITPESDRIVFTRSPAPMQQLSFGINTLLAFSQQAQQQLVGVDVDIVGATVQISTKTYNSPEQLNDVVGQIFVVAVDSGGSTLGLTTQKVYTNVPSHYGFNVTSDSEAGIPNFTFGTMGAQVSIMPSSNPSFVTGINDEPNFAALGGRINEFVEILNRYNVATLTQTFDSNQGERVLVTAYNPANTQLSMLEPNFMMQDETPIKNNDRYFCRTSYHFDSNDTTNVIIDNNEVTQSFTMPVARQLLVSSASTPTNQSFSATDNQSSLALNNQSSFLDFDFSNFKAWRQAQTTLTNGTYSLLIQAADFGPVGDNFRVGFVYPSNISDTTLSSNFVNSELIDLQIVLPVVTARTPNWDNTTSFAVSVVTTGGADSVTYTWQSGTQPNFITAGVVIGDVVIIGSSTSLPTGDSGFSAQVTAVTATSFTVKIPTGTATDDNTVISNIVNQAGLITVTTASPTNLTTGDIVGLYDTDSPSGGSPYPFNTSYQISVLTPTSFTMPTPAAVPGGGIQSGTFINNVVTINTVAPHGLYPGNIILISGTSSPFDGLIAVYSTPSTTQFTMVKSGTNPPISNIGRFDFQTYANSGSVPASTISTVTQAGYLVTVNTSLPNTLVPGNLVSIQNVTINNWSNVTTYAIGDIVTDTISNTLFVAIAPTTGNQPSTSPTYWSPTTLDYTGTFVVNTTPTTSQFTFYYLQNDTGNNTAGTGGTATLQAPEASLARAINGTGSANLQFGAVSTTAQAVADYATNNLAGQLVITVNNGAPNATITESTQDLGAASNYLSGAVAWLTTTISQNTVIFTVNNNVPAGSTITVSGLTAGNAAYNGTYAVFSSVPSVYVFGDYDVTVQSGVYAAASSSASVSASYTGSTPYLILIDGENSIASSNVSAISPTPMFLLKYPWATIPAIGEQIRLICTTSDQVTRFWNELIVAGLSNVAEIKNSQYARQVEIITDDFGGGGSVQVVGGTANSLSIALVGSGSDNQSRYGEFQIPYDLRSGLVQRMWLNVQNQIAQNKQIGFSPTTVLQVMGDGIEITGGTGTFQTVRATTQDATTTLKIENHGQFMAFIGINGTSMGLAAGGVQEGDWVVIQNVTAGFWNILTAYTTGQQVNYNGTNYTALSNNTGHEPDTSPTFWQIQQFNPDNTGIYQIVRTFGQDAFWIYAPNSVEDMMILGNAANLAFYSYDSVMPGDLLIIATNALGTANVGQYLVAGPSTGPSYFFPTATRIWTATIPNPPIGTITLGSNSTLVNVQEANPINLWKRILSYGPANGTLANILVDTPNLVTRLSSSLGAYLIGEGKLQFTTQVEYGIYSYQYFEGLIAALHQVIYGDPTNPLNYPGIRASGTNIRILPALIYRVLIGLAIRTQIGVPFQSVSDAVRASVAGYIGTLGVGDPVNLSQVVAAAQTVPGVLSVVITSPTYNAANDQIPISANQRAEVVNSQTDISVSQIGES